MRPILSCFQPEPSSPLRGEPKNLPDILAYCHKLLRKGRGVDALAVARRGLQRFPFSRDLQDVLRATWKREGAAQLCELRERVQRESNEESWEALLVHLIEHGDLDAAERESAALVSAHADDAWALFLRGATLAFRFSRERVAKDGGLALHLLEAAADLDPSMIEARILLAELLDSLGAPSAALFHLYQASDQAPESTRVAQMIEALSQKAPESESAGDLLRGCEERAFVGCTEELDDPDIRSQATRLCDTAIVTRLGVARGDAGFALSKTGEAQDSGGEKRGGFLDLAMGFSRSASLSAKRMGIGSFQEAELTWRGGGLLAFDADTTSLYVELEGRGRHDELATEARLSLASWAAKEEAQQ